MPTRPTGGGMRAVSLWTFCRAEGDETQAIRAVFGAVMAETEAEARQLLPLDERNVELRLHAGPVGIVAWVEPPKL